MYTKQYYWNKGFDQFNSGKRIAVHGRNNWQACSRADGYEFAKAQSILSADSPEEFQQGVLKGVIKCK